MNEDIKFMMSRFSAYKEQILDAYETNEEFKSLCEDFYSSALILENYKKKMLKDKKNELEYRKVFLDLENEILNFLGTEDNA
jgi:hypothetical protein